MEFREAIEEILTGNALLFCGAGFSYGATSQTNEEIFGVSKLINELCSDLKYEEIDEDLEYVSDEYIKKFGEAKLIELLKKNFFVKEVKDYHKIIVNLPWRRIYTTNYDNVIEKASERYKESITIKDAPKEYSKLSELIIHLNGRIGKLNSETLKTEFKLTGRSYLSEEFIKSAWYEIFKNDIASCRSIFFIGFSLKYDLDLKRAFTSNEIKNKIFFINGDKLHQKDINILNNFGNIIKNDAERFSEQILEIKKEYRIPKFNKKSLYCFKEYERKEESHGGLDSKKIFDLLTLGDFELSLFIQNNVNGNYLFERSIKKNIMKDIADKIKIIIVHSDLGNGKTMFLETLKYQLSFSGEVYELVTSDDDFYGDFEKIIESMEKKKYVIVENYNLYLEVLEKISVLNVENVTFILSARSFINDLTNEKLQKLAFYDSKKVTEYNLNSLDSKEITSIIKYLDTYNLWGRDSLKTEKEKRRMIEKECSNNISSILLKVFKSTDVSRKIEALIKGLDKNIETFLLIILINNILNLELNKNDIISYLELQGQFDKYMREEKIKQLLVNEERTIKIKSSILGKFILNSFITNEKIVDALTLLMKKTDKLATKRAKNLRFTLISFSNFQLLINKDSEKAIVNYYESIQNLNSCKTNAFFWIQYANVRISLKEFELAEFCLETAKAYTKADSTPHYDTCYARFLLENAIYKNKKENSYEIFKEAHLLLLDTKNEENKWHFPFKQTQLYKQYYDKFYNSFTENEKALFSYSILEMLKKIDQYKEKRIRTKNEIYKNVKVAEKQLKKILKDNGIQYNKDGII